MPNDQEKKYITPYVLGVSELGTNVGEIGIFIARVLKLPQGVQNIFRSFSTAEFIVDKLGQTFNLNAGQTTELTRITRDILLADAFWGDFPALVSSKLGVDVNTANQIVKTITEELFAPALDEIKTMQRNKFGDRIQQSDSGQVRQTPTETGNVINLRNQNNNR